LARIISYEAARTLSDHKTLILLNALNQVWGCVRCLYLVALSAFPIDKHCNDHSTPSFWCRVRPYHIQAFARGRCDCQFSTASRSMRNYVVNHGSGTTDVKVYPKSNMGCWSGTTDVKVNPKSNMGCGNGRRRGYKDLECTSNLIQIIKHQNTICSSLCSSIHSTPSPSTTASKTRRHRQCKPSKPEYSPKYRRAKSPALLQWPKARPVRSLKRTLPFKSPEANYISGNFTYTKAHGPRSVKDGETSEPLKTDGIFFLASCTKLLTAISALQCVERGQFTLDEDVTRLLPELKDMDILKGFEAESDKPILVKATKTITLRQVVHRPV
jgi:hypothetical protein